MPVPPHVFVLDGERLRYGQLMRDRQSYRFRSFRQAALPRDAFQSGPLGGPLRDPAAFQSLVGGLVREVPGGLKEASLVVPDAWLRVAFTEISDVPKTAEQRDEVLRWKLRRLVPFRVDELRVDAVEVTPLPVQEEPRRLLLGFAVEQLLAQIEESFAAQGVRLGQISNVSLSLLPALAPLTAPEARGTFTGLVVADAGGYTLILARGKEPVLHRYKAFTGDMPEGARSSSVVRDLKLTHNFLDEHFAGAALGRLLLVSPPELEPVWLDRLEEGFGRAAQPLDGRHLPPVRSDEGKAPPWRELAPMLGAARQEVTA
ncbi:MAG TPA: hypothetical protein VHU81_11420 [Thermoanaerobaculia bacterium]|nr:hypothetical protein [Thermoanaerobaculia bacterium]